MKYLKKYNENINSNQKEQFEHITTNLEGLLVELNDMNYYFSIKDNSNNDFLSTYCCSIHIKYDRSYTFEIGKIFDIIKTLESYLITKDLKASYRYYCHLETGEEEDYECHNVDLIDTDVEIIDLHIYIEEIK